MRHALIVPVAIGVAAGALVFSDVAAGGAGEPLAGLHAGHVHTEACTHPDCARPTPLHLAALRGDTKEILRLIAGGMDPGVRDALGETALHSAIRRFRVKSAAALLVAGAPLEALNDEGRTPLTLLASMGPSNVPEVDARKVEIAALLVQWGADPNVLDATGASALGYAAYREHPILEGLLRDVGARPGETDPAAVANIGRAPSGYLNNAGIGAALLAIENDHPTIAKRVSLGTVPGPSNRQIWAIKISNNIGVEEDEPEVSYISTMHGDEVTGSVMCLNLADWLTDNYGSIQRATDMVDGMVIWLVPTMNPDGYDGNSRYNSNGVDLNRDFPDQFDDPINTPAGREVETGLIMNWRAGESFVLSANLHGGALLCNYPWDGNPAGASVYSACPDDDVFIDISLEYSEDNTPMYNSPSFPQGITNGADWYAVNGGMQDWNYVWLGCKEITIELSNTKSPAYSQMATFWTQNQESMISYLERAFDGVRGVITDSVTGDPVFASVRVTGRDFTAYTDPDVGDYHRLLLPGTYELTFEADGYETLVAPSVVVTSGARSATRLDIQMDPTGVVAAAEVTYPNGGESLPAGVEQILTWDGSPTAQYQVQHTSNYDDSGLVIDSFESGSFGPEYSQGGNAGWTIVGSPVHTGSFAAKAGAITHNQTSWFERTVDGPASISFFYRVSSESGYDYFRFHVDGVEQASASGTTGWVEVVHNVGAGSHTLRWSYNKDFSVSSGSDTAWVDDIKTTADTTVWTDVVALTGTGVTSHPWTPSAETADAKIRVRKVLAGGVYGDWDESDAVFAVVPPAGCVGDLDGDFDTDVFDFNIFAPAFGSTGLPPFTGGDLDGDGDVDVFDFNLFAPDFGCTP